jgi:hypothetical protein
MEYLGKYDNVNFKEKKSPVSSDNREKDILNFRSSLISKFQVNFSLIVAISIINYFCYLATCPSFYKYFEDELLGLVKLETL